MARSAPRNNVTETMNNDSAAIHAHVKHAAVHTLTSGLWKPVRFMALLAIAGSLAACTAIIPRFELRDDYMFKRFLQPDRVVSEVERDELGNPILPETAQDE